MSLKIVNQKSFTNGTVYCAKTEDNFLIETTDTFLPYYTKNCINGANTLTDANVGDRSERWLVGVSVQSGCPCKCRFCATGQMKKFRNLTSDEIVEQVQFVLSQHPELYFCDSKEHKINYTRCGEPFLNFDNLTSAIFKINSMYPKTHHYVSTIGIKDSDFSWIKGNISLQVSLHSLKEDKRNRLIPYKNKMSIKELGQIRTQSDLKTTVNLTLVDEDDFDINLLKEYFDPDHFFIKLSPINVNVISEKNNLGSGVISTVNLI